MLTISKPLSSSQAKTYHAFEFTSETQSYYQKGGSVEGEWQGQLAGSFGLSGPVSAEDFARLAEGQHPQTGAELVKHRHSHEYAAPDGSVTKSVEHRAGVRLLAEQGRVNEVTNPQARYAAPLQKPFIGQLRTSLIRTPQVPTAPRLTRGKGRSLPCIPPFL